MYNNKRERDLDSITPVLREIHTTIHYAIHHRRRSILYRPNKKLERFNLGSHPYSGNRLNLSSSYEDTHGEKKIMSLNVFGINIYLDLILYYNPFMEEHINATVFDLVQ